MRVVKIVAAYAHLCFEPPGTAFLARKQSPVRTHDFGPLRRGQRVANEVSCRGGFRKNGHLPVKFLAHRHQGRSWRGLRRRLRRRYRRWATRWRACRQCVQREDHHESRKSEYFHGGCSRMPIYRSHKLNSLAYAPPISNTRSRQLSWRLRLVCAHRSSLMRLHGRESPQTK